MSLTKSQVESIVRNTITEYVSETTVSGKMKAYVMNEERKMVIKEMPEPVPKADNMIVKINYASICGTDFRTFMKGNAKITPPRIMGHESAGVVIHVGAYAEGIGGGSPLDVSKAISILAKNGGNIEDYNGLDKSKKSGVPLIAINTTAGTGSEVTRAYVVTDEVRKVKMLMVDAHCLSYLALNDPALMVDMPAPLTAATGMDALTHAVEAYVAKSHFPFTDGLALEAIGLVAKSLQKACENGRDMDARTDMCWAEYMAGLAFSNAGLGMVHAMAHQLGGFYNTPHGVANAILLTHVMKFNLPSCKERYADIARALKINTAHMTPDQAANAAITYIEQLAERIHIPKLSETAFKPSDVLTLSLHALEDTGMPENPREATLVDVQKVFMDAYYAK